MVIEVQLYLDQFLEFRKTVHCFYKITRAPTLSSLAQDCRKYAVNPAEAYDRQRELDYAAAAADVAGRVQRLERESDMLAKDLAKARSRFVALRARCNSIVA